MFWWAKFVPNLYTGDPRAVAVAKLRYEGVSDGIISSYLVGSVDSDQYGKPLPGQGAVVYFLFPNWESVQWAMKEYGGAAEQPTAGRLRDYRIARVGEGKAATEEIVNVVVEQILKEVG